jgi:S-adenosylmethionine:tRNA ribosyltransferase-isomerase
MKRLMVIDRKKQTIEHKLFKDVIDYFDDGDVLILNTKVFQHVCTETKKKQGLELSFYLEN